MRIGIYGGSFNPIHKAHVEIVKFILKKLELDRIIIIPVGKASHRDDIMLSGYPQYLPQSPKYYTLP